MLPTLPHVGKRSNNKVGVRRRFRALVELGGKTLSGATINLLGLTFKENVTDIRNSKVAELRAELVAQGARVHVNDPLADPAAARHEYGIELEEWSALPRADALILAVAHRAYRERGTAEFLGKLAPGGLHMLETLG